MCGNVILSPLTPSTRTLNLHFTAVLLCTGLLGLHARFPVSPAILLTAAALHLDVADAHRQSAAHAWTVLAQTLSNAAKVLRDLEVNKAKASCIAGSVTGCGIQTSDPGVSHDQCEPHPL